MPPVSHGRLRASWAWGVAVVTAALQLARLATGGWDFDTVWAEDGRVFLRDADRLGVASFGYTYAGYLHTVPRLIGLGGTVLPWGDYDLWAVGTSVLLVGALAAFTAVVCTRLLGSARWALFPAVGMALVPAAAQESLANVANLQWTLIPATFAALALGRSGSRGLQVAAVAVALATALSSPLALFAVPAALLPGWRRGLGAPLVACGVGLVVQGVAVLAAPASDLVFRRESGVTLGLFRRFLSGVLAPDRGPATLTAAVGLAVTVGLVLLVRVGGRGRRLAVLSGSSAGAFYLFTAVLTGPQARYNAATAVLLSFGVASLAVHAPPRARRSVLVVAAGLVVVGFPASAYRVSGPGWTAPAERAEQSCRDGAAQSTPLSVGPEGYNGSSFRLSCPVP